MATLDFSQLSKIWKVTAAGVGITFLAVGGTFWVNRVQNSAGITTRTEYSDGRTTQSGELLVKSGSLAVRLQANGDVNAQGTVSGNHLYAGTLSGAGLTDCDADNQTVAWDATTQRFGCGDDDTGAGGSAWSGTGALQTYFDPRYVNTSGDTMTGKLLINLTTGTDALEVVQTASASKLHANTLLTVSGSVVVEDNLNVDGLMSFVGYSANPQLTAADTTTGLHFDGPGITSIHNGGIQTMLLSSTNNVGIGDSAPETKLEVDGTVSGTVLYGLQSLRSSGALTWEGDGSGASLYLGTFLKGAGLTDCDIAGISKLLWDTTTGRFSCGTDTDTNTTYTAGKGLTLTSTAFSTNDTLTGTMLRFLTVSGSLVYGKSTLASSGTIVAEGAISGASLYSATSFRGSGLVDCDIAGTSKLLWDTTTGRFSCGTDTDTNTTYTAGQGLTLTSTSFRLNASHSGTVIWAGTTLRSSGGLVVESTTSGATAYFGSLFIGKPALSTNTKLDVLGTISGALITQHGAGNNFFQGNVGIGKTPTTKLEVVGTVSGSVLYGNSTVRSSGSLVWEQAGSGRTLTVSNGATVGALAAVTLKSCVFLYTDSSGNFTCGSLPTRTIILTAGGGIPSVLTGSGASGPEITTGTTNDTSMYVLEYGNTAKPRYAMWTATMPDNYDGGTLTFLFNWRTAATSGDVKWFIQCRSLGDNEAVDQSWGTAQSVTDTAATANSIRTTSATAAVTCAGTPAGGEIIQFRVYRDPADGSDTLANTGALISVKGEYSTNALSD